jgi:peptidoglycan/LPS O-acetylase OafA/YrhL
MATENRYYELDSLRGIAAMCVVFAHYFGILPVMSEKNGPAWVWLLKHTPIHIFWAGHEAVIFFFVLSGFVLSLQFFGKKVAYPGFLIKRVCRIYLPYIVAAVTAIVAAKLFYSGQIPGLSPWANRYPPTMNDAGLIVNHFILITDFRNGVFNPVLWSLVHEMRISIIFPFIMIFIIKYDWKINLVIAACATITGMGLHFMSRRIFGTTTDCFMTIHFISMFIIGGLLAKYRHELVGWYRSLKARSRYGLLGIAVLFYTCSWLVHMPVIIGWTPDWAISLGVAIFIIAAIGSDKIATVLLWKPVHFIGKISFSVYLFHAIILLCLVHILYATVPIIGIWIIGLILTILISAASFKYVELPSIAAGRFLSNILKKF